MLFDEEAREDIGGRTALLLLLLLLLKDCRHASLFDGSVRFWRTGHVDAKGEHGGCCGSCRCRRCRSGGCRDSGSGGGGE